MHVCACVCVCVCSMCACVCVCVARVCVCVCIQHMCACVRVCVCTARVCLRACVFVYSTCVCVRACVCVCGRAGSSTSLIALYVNLNEAVALVRITQGYTCIICSVSYVCLPQQYVAHLHIAPDGAFMNHTRLMSDGLSSNTRTASQGEILCESQL